MNFYTGAFPQLPEGGGMSIDGLAEHTSWVSYDFDATVGLWITHAFPVIGELVACLLPSLVGVLVSLRGSVRGSYFSWPYHWRSGWLFSRCPLRLLYHLVLRLGRNWSPSSSPSLGVATAGYHILWR